MRKLALFATIAATLLAVSGCARWTLRPLHGQREAAAAQNQDKNNALTSLMHGPSGARRAVPLEPTQDPAVDRPINAGLDAIPRELAVARLSERQGDENQARQIYLEYIAKDPRNPLPHHRLGVMAARKSKLDEAEKHLRKALECAPPSVELLNDMGYLCYLKSRFDEAEHYLLQSLEQSPDNKSATNNLALVYGARGDFSKSLHYFRRVNDDARSHANVAFTMTQQGKLEDARNEYLHALTIDKTLKSAANALVQIEQTRKAAEKAAKRNGTSPPDANQQRDVIELATTHRPSAQPTAMMDARQQYAAPQPQYAPAAYQPQPRPENVAAAAMPQREMQPASGGMAQPAATGDQFAGRLMALPPLPATQSAEPVFTPVTPSSSAPRHDAVAVNAAQHSQFSTPPGPQQVASRPSSVEPVAMSAQQSQGSDAAIASIFSEARQVSWDSQNTNAEGKSRFSTIPIPTSEPRAGDSQEEVRQAIAVASTKPAANTVRPVSAVQMGLSDDTPPAAAPKREPVKAQFSDFGSVPARLNSSASVAPLGTTR